MNGCTHEMLWRDVEGEMRPLATRCGDCTLTVFPPALRCRFCGSLKVADATLNPRGRVESASLMHGLLLVHVRTADGVLLLGHAEPADCVRIGSNVRFRPSGKHMKFELDD